MVETRYGMCAYSAHWINKLDSNWEFDLRCDMLSRQHYIPMHLTSGAFCVTSNVAHKMTAGFVCLLCTYCCMLFEAINGHRVTLVIRDTTENRPRETNRIIIFNLELYVSAWKFCWLNVHRTRPLQTPPPPPLGTYMQLIDIIHFSPRLDYILLWIRL